MLIRIHYVILKYTCFNHINVYYIPTDKTIVLVLVFSGDSVSHMCYLKHDVIFKRSKTDSCAFLFICVLNY